MGSSAVPPSCTTDRAHGPRVSRTFGPGANTAELTGSPVWTNLGPPLSKQDPLPPLPVESAARAVLRCVGAAAVLLFRRRIRLPRRRLGRRVHFADGTTGVVYRETIADGVAALEPCTLLVISACGASGVGLTPPSAPRACSTHHYSSDFRDLSAKCGSPRSARRVSRPLRMGRPRAGDRLRPSLWRVLALVSTPGSIHYAVVTGILPPRSLPRGSGSHHQAGSAGTAGQWWQIIDPPRPAASPPPPPRLRVTTWRRRR